MKELISMKDLAQIRADNSNPVAYTDRALENRKVRVAFRESFLGALPQWQKNLLREYVEAIPVRGGR